MDVDVANLPPRKVQETTGEPATNMPKKAQQTAGEPAKKETPMSANEQMQIDSVENVSDDEHEQKVLPMTAEGAEHTQEMSPDGVPELKIEPVCSASPCEPAKKKRKPKRVIRRGKEEFIDESESDESDPPEGQPVEPALFDDEDAQKEAAELKQGEQATDDNHAMLSHNVFPLYSHIITKSGRPRVAGAQKAIKPTSAQQGMDVPAAGAEESDKAKPKAAGAEESDKAKPKAAGASESDKAKPKAAGAQDMIKITQGMGELTAGAQESNKAKSNAVKCVPSDGAQEMTKAQDQSKFTEQHVEHVLLRDDAMSAEYTFECVEDATSQLTQVEAEKASPLGIVAEDEQTVLVVPSPPRIELTGSDEDLDQDRNDADLFQLRGAGVSTEDTEMQDKAQNDVQVQEVTESVDEVVTGTQEVTEETGQSSDDGYHASDNEVVKDMPTPKDMQCSKEVAQLRAKVAALQLELKQRLPSWDFCDEHECEGPLRLCMLPTNYVMICIGQSFREQFEWFTADRALQQVQKMIGIINDITFKTQKTMQLNKDQPAPVLRAAWQSVIPATLMTLAMFFFAKAFDRKLCSPTMFALALEELVRSVKSRGVAHLLILTRWLFGLMLVGTQPHWAPNNKVRAGSVAWDIDIIEMIRTSIADVLKQNKKAKTHYKALCKFYSEKFSVKPEFFDSWSEWMQAQADNRPRRLTVVDGKSQCYADAARWIQDFLAVAERRLRSKGKLEKGIVDLTEGATWYREYCEVVNAKKKRDADYIATLESSVESLEQNLKTKDGLLEKEKKERNLDLLQFGSRSDEAKAELEKCKKKLLKASLLAKSLQNEVGAKEDTIHTIKRDLRLCALVQQRLQDKLENTYKLSDVQCVPFPREAIEAELTELAKFQVETHGGTLSIEDAKKELHLYQLLGMVDRMSGITNKITRTTQSTNAVIARWLTPNTELAQKAGAAKTEKELYANLGYLEGAGASKATPITVEDGAQHQNSQQRRKRLTSTADLPVPDQANPNKKRKVEMNEQVESASSYSSSSASVSPMRAAPMRAASMRCDVASSEQQLLSESERKLHGLLKQMKDNMRSSNLLVLTSSNSGRLKPTRVLTRYVNRVVGDDSRGPVPTGNRPIAFGATKNTQFSTLGEQLAEAVILPLCQANAEDARLAPKLVQQRPGKHDAVGAPPAAFVIIPVYLNIAGPRREGPVTRKDDEHSKQASHRNACQILMQQKADDVYCEWKRALPLNQSLHNHVDDTLPRMENLVFFDVFRAPQMGYPTKTLAITLPTSAVQYRAGKDTYIVVGVKGRISVSVTNSTDYSRDFKYVGAQGYGALPQSRTLLLDQASTQSRNQWRLFIVDVGPYPQHMYVTAFAIGSPEYSEEQAVGQLFIGTSKSPLQSADDHEIAMAWHESLRTRLPANLRQFKDEQREKAQAEASSMQRIEDERKEKAQSAKVPEVPQVPQVPEALPLALRGMAQVMHKISEVWHRIHWFTLDMP